MKASSVTPEVLANIEEQKRRLEAEELILIFDMGEGCPEIKNTLETYLGVVCLVVDPKTFLAGDVKMLDPKGIIITDCPRNTVMPAKKAVFDREILSLEIPVLGIGIGRDIIAKFQHLPEWYRDEPGYQIAHLQDLDPQSELLHGCTEHSKVLERCNVAVEGNAIVLKTAGTDKTTNASVIESAHLHGVCFSLHDDQTSCGDIVLANFVNRICLKRPSALLSQVAKRFNALTKAA